MDRFSASDREDRRLLFADAIRAHRERGSPFLTLEADRDATPEDELDSHDSGGETDVRPPWVQFGDGVVNMDCTEAELDRLKSLLGEFPAFEIADLVRPEEAEGVNANVSAYADEGRIAAFVDRVFREVYAQPDDYRVWAAAV